MKKENCRSGTTERKSQGCVFGEPQTLTFRMSKGCLATSDNLNLSNLSECVKNREPLTTRVGRARASEVLTTEKDSHAPYLEGMTSSHPYYGAPQVSSCHPAIEEKSTGQVQTRSRILDCSPSMVNNAGVVAELKNARDLYWTWWKGAFDER